MTTWNLNLFCWLKARLLCRINRLSHSIWSTILLTSTFTCNCPWAGKGKSVIVISLFIMLTYPMIDWCILQKYISQPLLLSLSGPCRHIGSEMYLHSSRPRMHANSASREIWRFLWQVEASSSTRSSDHFCCISKWWSFPSLREKIRPFFITWGTKYLKFHRNWIYFQFNELLAKR